MDPMNLILIAEPGERRERYLENLSEYPVEVDCVTTADEIFEKCREKFYSGLMLDIRTMMKSTSRKRWMVEQLSFKFPTIRLQVLPGTGRVKGLVYDETVPGEDALGHFMNKCGDFEPSRIRISLRIKKIFNVWILRQTPGCRERQIEASTLNLSLGGCFITTQEHFNLSDRFKIRIKELKGTDPIECEVQWVQEWGREGRLPGVGVFFSVISHAQEEEVSEHLAAATKWF